MMKTKQTAPENIDEYIAGFPKEIQEILEKIRMTIRKAAPDTEEAISYKIPTFNLKGHYLIYFAAYKNHIGLYPAPIGNADFKEEMSAYESGKGTLKFPLDKPIPFELTRFSMSLDGLLQDWTINIPARPHISIVVFDFRVLR